MNKPKLHKGDPAIKWATRAIAEGEGTPHPSDAGKVAIMRELAVMVADAPEGMLDAAMDELFELLKNMPADTILPILSELLQRRPGVIEKAMAERTAVGTRVSHIEKSLYIAYLFAPVRIAKMAAATNSCLSSLRGREPVME